MALTGVMLADFSALKKEAAESAAALKQVESGGEAAATKLTKIGEGVNIKSTLNDPLGTASQLAGEFASSLGTVGVAAVATAGGIAALGVAVFELGVGSAKVIAEFDDLADKTGMSVPKLSQLSHAANIVGADLNQLTDVVFKLERGIGENSDTFQKGLAQMGLSTEQLKAAGPDQYLELVTEGLKGIEDPSAKAAAGTAVLGKGYKDVAASLNDLADGLELAKSIEPFTKQQAADAEKFLFQLNALKEQVTALGVSIGADLIGPLSTMVGWLLKAKTAYDELPQAVKNVLSPVAAAKAAYGEASAALQVLTGAASALPIDLDKASAAMQRANDVTTQLKVNVPTLTDALAAQKEMITVDAAALAEWQKAVEALTGSTAGWQQTLDTVDGAVAEGIKFYLSAGVSQADLAKAYGLTAQQVKAVATSLEEYSATLHATADFEKSAADQRTAISQRMTQAINDEIIATLKKKQAEQEANDAFLAAALKDAQAQDAIQQGIGETADTTVAAGGTMRSSFEESFAASASAFESFKGVVVAGTGEMAAAVQGGFSAATNAGAWAERQRSMFEDQMARGTPFVVGGGALPPMQTRDSGGPVEAGQSYMIGLNREPEIFTPGATGFVTPTTATKMTGASSGGSPVGGGIVVNNVFNIVDTEAGITRRVSDNITRSIMQAQKL